MCFLFIVNRERIIHQYSYEILDIIIKMLPIITPIITSFFITCCPKNILICTLDTVYRFIVLIIEWEYSFMAILPTYCIKSNGISIYSITSFITSSLSKYYLFPALSVFSDMFILKRVHFPVNMICYRLFVNFLLFYFVSCCYIFFVYLISGVSNPSPGDFSSNTIFKSS